MIKAVELFIVLQLLLGAPLDTLVTKEQGLPAWYAPGQDPAAMAAMDEMRHAAADANVLLWVTSDYRSYHDQTVVVERELDRAPDRFRSYTAHPGHSEHQLGTTFDVAWPGLTSYSLDDRNLVLFNWLEQHAHKFGFVISFPYKQTESWPFHNRWLPVVTEYIYEPWHLRYVGRELAGQMWSRGYIDPGSTILPQDFYIPWP